MSVSLQKGQKVNLRKSQAEVLTRVMVGLGWDEVEQNAAGTVQDIDCDASVVLCKNGKLVSPKDDVIYYNHLSHFSGAVEHQGDNLTGEGEGDSEQILVDLASLPSGYDRIVFVVTIYKAPERGQHFGMIDNAYIRVCDMSSGAEFCRFDLSDNYYGKTAMIVGEMIKIDGEWKFNALGQATNDNGINEMIKHFR